MKRRLAFIGAFVLLAMMPGLRAMLCAEPQTLPQSACDSASEDSPATAPSTQPAIGVRDASGQVQHPLEVGPDHHAAVLLFIDTDCPISNSYAQEFGRLIRDYQPKGFAIYFVYCSSETTAASAKAHARQFDLDSTLLLDPDCTLAKRVGAHVTPEAVVIGNGEQVLYRGRVDDLYYGLSKRRFEATHHDLRDALDAIAAGKPVTTAHTEPIGCAIAN